MGYATLVVGRKIEKIDTSPRASGPAGSQFEVKVATHYALALLAKTEAFGLPGVVAEEIAFQRGAQGHPLDDVVLKGVTNSGETRILDLQAKRSMAFTVGDKNFASVVKAIVKTRRDEPDGRERRYAVAIERTSGPIENGVQEALELARSVESANAFFTLLGTDGRHNADTRGFVEAFRKHLDQSGVADEDELFAILTRFSVLHFDYARPNSAAEAYDRMRAKLLSSAKADDDLYDSLYGHISRLDSIGGGTTRIGLIEDLQGLGVSLAGAPQLAKARARLDEMSVLALSDINETVKGVSVIRARRNKEVEEALDTAAVAGGVVEISGPGGVGKSALLKTQAFRRREACRILALAPDRTPSGGWVALRHELEIDADAANFFADLACDGGGLVCIDGLDRYRDAGQRNTVIDVLRFATATLGVAVLFTARPDRDEAPLAWLPDDVRQKLTARRTVVVDELDDDEAEALGTDAPELVALLKPDHPARALARNLFILRRLADAQPGAENVGSEAQLAKYWWKTGGHGLDVPSGEQRERRRVLAAVAQAMLVGASLADVSGFDAVAVDGLVTGEVIVELGPADLVKFRHDLSSDWALGCYLFEDTARINELALSVAPPYWLSRAFELACRCIAEGADESAFPALLDRLSEDSVAPAWLGLALLALVRSERCEGLLGRYANTLLHGDGERGAILIRRAMGAHGRPAAKVLAGFLPEGVMFPDGITLPYVPVWVPLIVWTESRFEQLPAKTLAAALELYEHWMVISISGEDRITAELLERVADLLVAHIEDDDRPIAPFARGAPPPIRYPISNEGVRDARTMMALYAQHAPSAAARYLEAVAASEQAAKHVHQLLEFAGNLPMAAPAAFVAAIRKAVEQDTGTDEDGSWSSRSHRPFWRLDGPFVLGRAGIDLFRAILNADEAAGLSLIRDLLRHEEQWVSEEVEGFDLEFFGVERRVAPDWSYGWSRGTGPSSLLSSALAALEQWGHEVIEAGQPLEAVLSQILDDGEISGALLLTAVDLVLSHDKTASPVLWDLMASPETLALDADRANRDAVDQMTGGSFSSSLRVGSAADRQIKEQLSARPSRSLALHDAIPKVIWSVKESQTQSLRNRLDAAVQRLGTWDRENVDWSSPSFMASHALRLASRENYEEVSEKDADGRQIEGWRFVWPERQRLWLESQLAEQAADSSVFSRALAVRMAMDDDRREVRATVEMADQILAETADAQPGNTDELHDPNDPWINRIAAAAFVARYGSNEKLQACRADFTVIFDQALVLEPDAGQHSHSRIMYDPGALAITGLLYLASRSGDADDLRRLLYALFQHNSKAAVVCLGHREAVKALGARAVQAMVRIGIEACVSARRARFDEDPQAYAAREAAARSRCSLRLEAEEAWLFENVGAPAWRCPPPHRARRSRRSIRLPGGAPKPAPQRREPEWPDFYFDAQTAANWTRCLTALGTEASDPVKALIITNKDWLIEANAAGADADESDIERTWTRALMEHAAEHAKTWSAEKRSELVFDILAAFSDEAFIDAAAVFLVKSDSHHLEGAPDDTGYLVDLRQTIWARLKETRHWHWHLRSSSRGMEIHLKEIIAAFFFKISYGLGKEESYTGGMRDDQIAPFFPILTEIAIDAGSCPTTALLFLDALEMVEAPVAAPFVLDAAVAWTPDGDTQFWKQFGVGRRVCILLGSMQISSEEVAQLSTIADAVSAAGVPEVETLRTAVKESGG